MLLFMEVPVNKSYFFAFENNKEREKEDGTKKSDY